MLRAVVLVVLLGCLAAGAPQDWQDNPMFKPGWSPIPNAVPAADPAAPAAEVAPAAPAAPVEPAAPAAPADPAAAPADSAAPVPPAGPLDKGGSMSSSENTAKSGQLADGSLYATALSNSGAKVTSLTPGKFQLALGKGTAGASAVKG